MRVKRRSLFSGIYDGTVSAGSGGACILGKSAYNSDTRKVTTIEEFKNKKFRYQLSETAVEVERMVIRIENLLIEGSSLEPTLLERLRTALEGWGRCHRQKRKSGTDGGMI